MIKTTAEYKSSVLKAMRAHKENFEGSDKNHATFFGINPATYSQIMAGNLFKTLADDRWVSIGRKLGVGLNGKVNWKTARTPVFEAISSILRKCQRDSLSAIICDDPGVGKTHTAKEYVKANKNTAYVDASQCKSKRDFVKAISKEFGLSPSGTFKDTREDLIYYLTTQAENPLIVIDEAGDLNSEATLEIKGLWNATEKSCGWVLMGADGLKEKIKRGISLKIVGYTETHSRFGSKFQRVTPEGGEKAKEFQIKQAAMVIEANRKPGVNVGEMLKKTGGELRRINIELSKI